MYFRIHTYGVLISPRIAFQTNGNRKAIEHDFTSPSNESHELVQEPVYKSKGFRL